MIRVSDQTRTKVLCLLAAVLFWAWIVFWDVR